MKELLIGKNDAGQRLDKFLSKAVPRLPKSLLYKYIRLKRIKLNGKRCENSAMLQENDRLTLYINDEFFQLTSGKSKEFMKAPAELNLVYEDENLLLIDKPPGLVVHTDNSKTADSLINRVQYYLWKRGEFDPDREHSFAPALCNRIDRNTGGLVIAAKNAESLRILNEKIRNREIRKFYLCLTEGVVSPSTGILRGFLSKDSSQNKVFLNKEKTDSNKEIATKYQVIKSDKKYSLVEVELLTGRTHQIRAHMADIGHPLVGDKKYGAKEKSKYYMLYSYKIRFDFRSDAGILNGLNGKIFQTDKIWFANKI